MPGDRLILASLLLGAVLSACAAPRPAGRADADPGAVTCRDLLQPPSNVIRSVCATQAEWDSYARDQRFQTNDFFRGVTTTGGLRSN